MDSIDNLFGRRTWQAAARLVLLIGWSLLRQGLIAFKSIEGLAVLQLVVGLLLNHIEVEGIEVEVDFAFGYVCLLSLWVWCFAYTYFAKIEVFNQLSHLFEFFLLTLSHPNSEKNAKAVFQMLCHSQEVLSEKQGALLPQTPGHQPELVLCSPHRLNVLQVFHGFDWSFVFGLLCSLFSLRDRSCFKVTLSVYLSGV